VVAVADSTITDVVVPLVRVHLTAERPAMTTGGNNSILPNNVAEIRLLPAARLHATETTHANVPQCLSRGSVIRDRLKNVASAAVVAAATATVATAATTTTTDRIEGPS